MRAFAGEGFLVGAGCCAPASIRVFMVIARRTIKQRLANRHMSSSRVTVTWASKINKLVRETPIVLQRLSRHAVARSALPRKRRHALIIAVRTGAVHTLKSGVN